MSSCRNDFLRNKHLTATRAFLALRQPRRRTSRLDRFVNYNSMFMFGTFRFRRIFGFNRFFGATRCGNNFFIEYFTATRAFLHLQTVFRSRSLDDGLPFARRMTKRVRFVCRVSVTTYTSVGGIPPCRAGRCLHNGLVIMSERSNIIIRVSVCANGTGAGSIPLLRAGRCRHNRFVIVTFCSNLLRFFLAARTDS